MSADRKSLVNYLWNKETSSNFIAGQWFFLGGGLSAMIAHVASGMGILPEKYIDEAALINLGLVTFGIINYGYGKVKKAIVDNISYRQYSNL